MTLHKIFNELLMWTIIICIITTGCVKVKGHTNYSPLLAYNDNDSRIYFKQKYSILGPESLELYNLIAIDLDGKKELIVYADKFGRNIFDVATSESTNLVCYVVRSQEDSSFKQKLFVYNPDRNRSNQIFEISNELEDYDAGQIELLSLPISSYSGACYAWSPDARHIIFLVSGGGTYLAKRRDDHYSIKTISEQYEAAIAWSPDSKLFVTYLVMGVGPQSKITLTVRDIKGNIIGELVGIPNFIDNKLSFSGDSKVLYYLNTNNDVIAYDVMNNIPKVIARFDESEEIQILRITEGGEQIISATGRMLYYPRADENPKYWKLLYINLIDGNIANDITGYIPENILEIRYMEWINEDSVMLLYREMHQYNLSVINIKDRSSVRVISNVDNVVLSPDKSFAIVGGKDVIYRLNIDDLNNPKIIYR